MVKFDCISSWSLPFIYFQCLYGHRAMVRGFQTTEAFIPLTFPEIDQVHVDSESFPVFWQSEAQSREWGSEPRIFKYTLITRPWHLSKDISRI